MLSAVVKSSTTWASHAAWMAAIALIITNFIDWVTASHMYCSLPRDNTPQNQKGQAKLYSLWFDVHVYFEILNDLSHEP